MNLKSFKPVLTLICALGALNLAAQINPPIIDVNSGESYNYQIDIKTSSTQTMGGMQQSSEADQRVKVLFEVDKITENDEINLTATISDLSLSMNAMGMMDTTITTPGKFGPAYFASFDKFGKSIDRYPIDSVEKDPNNQFDFENASVTITLFLELPENKITEGEEWTMDNVDTVKSGPFSELIIRSVGTFVLDGIKTIDGVEVYKISSAEVIELIGTGDMNGMQISAEGEGANEGFYYVNTKNGVIEKRESLLELSMIIAISGQQSMTIPMVQKVNYSQVLISE
ncbi:MAG: hypothetical protein JXA77_10385 [Bacteroidales bacterium]|nr:hypothetical protein [Bacteroidales bacterium]MBN2817889.1 hypothetical protein [Bacteroidales bacterium]